ncbi:MAG: DUF4296 domain-containing protein, partial [Duncaniella sp.]|nr:DUF4296 domain-containing protein [Duncaniella sp.]
MSHLTTMRIFPLIAVAIGLGSMMMACHSRPGNIISEKKMAEILADVYVGEAVIESTPQLFTTDSARRAFKQEIFARHGVTNADVDTSLFWYGYNVEQYMEVCRQT